MHASTPEKPVPLDTCKSAHACEKIRVMSPVWWGCESHPITNVFSLNNWMTEAIGESCS